MITYTYIVRCPECEDEFFDFFDEAKDFAMDCLTKKPIITQIEVCRNDFGECTDSADLGTVWSWEDMMKDTNAEPTVSVFTKDDLECMNHTGKPCCDAEFDALDNSVDFEPETSEVSAVDTIPDNFRRPIPEGMTIEELVEEMEENEDTVECTWCEDLFDKSECRYEVDLGWLCSRCEMAIKSRGETLTFRENNYWDFLDEEVKEPDIVSDLGNTYDGGYPEERTWICYYNGNDLGTVEAATEEEAYIKMEKTWPEYNYNNEDIQVIPAEDDIENIEPSMVETLEEAADYRKRLDLCPECGAKQAFDHETGFCLECGFNI